VKLGAAVLEVVGSAVVVAGGTVVAVVAVVVGTSVGTTPALQSPETTSPTAGAAAARAVVPFK